MNSAVIPQDIVPALAADDDANARCRLLGLALDDGDREALLVRIKSESERYLYMDPRASLRLADSLILGSELANQPGHRALGLMAKGDALRYLGQYADSLVLFDQAAQAFEALGDEVGWARTRIGWLVSSHRLGRGPQALLVVEHARRVLVEHAEWFRAAALDLNAAVVCRELGEFSQALRLQRRAQLAYEQIGGQTGEIWAARAKVNQAIVVTQLGDFRAALALYEDARPAIVRSGETVSLLKLDHNMAYLHAGQGLYTRALLLLTDALALAEQTGLTANSSEIALNIVECYLALNRDADALHLGLETVERTQRNGALTDAARVRFLCGLASGRLGDIEQAERLMTDAAAAFSSQGLRTDFGLVVLHRAGLDLARANWSAALSYAEDAQRLFAERKLVVRQAQAQLVQARAFLGLIQYADANRLAASALTIAREADVLWLTHEAHHILATAARAEGDLQRARLEYDAAVNDIERVQSRQASDLRSTFLADKLQVFEDAIDCSLELRDVAHAFELLERAKSRALVDYLTAHPNIRMRAPDPDDQPLLDELAELREEHNWLYNRVYGQGLAAVDGPLSPSEAETLTRAIRERETRIARVMERLTLRRAAGLEDLTTPYATVRSELPTLDRETVLLEYWLPPHHPGVVFVGSAEGMTAVPLTASVADVRRLLNAWQLNVDSAAGRRAAGASVDSLTQNANALLRRLYQALIEPLAGVLADKKKLVVIPYGPLHGVPFSALHDGQRALVESLEVSVCPSSTLLRLCSERRQRPLDSALVVAHSDSGRLPNVLSEAHSIAALLPGEVLIEAAATRAAVIAAAPRYGVVHLAAHGEARLDNPAFAHLMLDDGQLSMDDVFNLELDGALVTLSACETGRSAIVGGDELVGLGRGFLHAGASTLVQSLWRVEDESTARLMRGFYSGIRAGLSKGAALRQAQLDLMDVHQHPYFWAPFQLVGHAGHTDASGAQRSQSRSREVHVHGVTKA